MVVPVNDQGDFQLDGTALLSYPAGEPFQPVQEQSTVAKSPKTAQWHREELIVVLDLYFRGTTKIGNPIWQARTNDSSIIAMSEQLRSWPLHPDVPRDGTKYRSPGSVHAKINNFVSLDPDVHRSGNAHVGRLDRQVWEEFAQDRDRLHRLAKLISGSVGEIDPSLIAEEPSEPDSDDEGTEGGIIFALHRRHERDSGLVKRFKAKLRREGDLSCCVCGFDFEKIYGERGADYIECHHTKPLSELTPKSKTRLSDLAPVCSNCHRMIHRRKPWLTVEELSGNLGGMKMSDALRTYIQTQRSNLSSVSQSPAFRSLVEGMVSLYFSANKLLGMKFSQFIQVQIFSLCYKSLLSAATLIGQRQPEDSVPITRLAVEMARLAISFHHDEKNIEKWMDYKNREQRWQNWRSGKRSERPRTPNYTYPKGDTPLGQLKSKLCTQFNIASASDTHFTPEHLGQRSWELKSNSLFLAHFEDEDKKIQSAINWLCACHFLILEVFDQICCCPLSSNAEWMERLNSYREQAKTFQIHG